jgi:hypothetical protein
VRAEVVVAAEGAVSELVLGRRAVPPGPELPPGRRLDAGQVVHVEGREIVKEPGRAEVRSARAARPPEDRGRERRGPVGLGRRALLTPGPEVHVRVPAGLRHEREDHAAVAPGEAGEIERGARERGVRGGALEERRSLRAVAFAQRDEAEVEARLLAVGGIHLGRTQEPLRRLVVAELVARDAAEEGRRGVPVRGVGCLERARGAGEILRVHAPEPVLEWIGAARGAEPLQRGAGGLVRGIARERVSVRRRGAVA